MTTLFDPEAHEPLGGTAWDPERARSAIRAIVSETERALHVRNAPSPAATSSFALARLIADRLV